MVSVKSIAKAFALVISGIAIVVVGGFMMGAVARLWSHDNKKSKQENDSESA